eukprot:SAG25_NODE_67_length_17436_cov_89.239257_8_plen_148_part_00
MPDISVWRVGGRAGVRCARRRVRNRGVLTGAEGSEGVELSNRAMIGSERGISEDDAVSRWIDGSALGGGTETASRMDVPAEGLNIVDEGDEGEEEEEEEEEEEQEEEEEEEEEPPLRPPPIDMVPPGVAPDLQSSTELEEVRGAETT